MVKILRKGGKVVLRNGFLQKIADGVDAGNCHCCNPACLCPDGEPQRTIANAVFTVTGLPSTYYEDQSDTSGGAFHDLELNGFDALNGSYNAILKSKQTPTPDPDPCLDEFTGCPLERNGCRWQITIPPVPITGMYSMFTPSVAYSSVVRGWANVGFLVNTGVPVLFWRGWLQTAHPFSGVKYSFSAGLRISGMRTSYKGVLLIRLSCETYSGPDGGHGLRASPELRTIVNAMTQSQPEILIENVEPTKLYAPFGICTTELNAFFGTTTYTTASKVTTGAVSSAGVSVTACSLNGGSAGSMAASYGLTINYNPVV